MPYLQRHWLGDQAPPLKSNLRTYPATDFEKEQAQQQAEQQAAKTIEPAAVSTLQETLKKQTEELQSGKGAILIKECPEYLNYVVDKAKPIFKGQHSSINHCSNPTFAGQAMIVREFKPTSLLKPDDFYLKVIRHLGKQHGSIIQTFDICVDERKHIFLFQEYAALGNGLDYIKNGNRVIEAQMLLWARAIYSAIDFLGERGISHRAIQPKHIFLLPVATATDPNEAITVKLGSFRDSVLYWDTAKGELITQPCKPMSQLKSSFFHAPEMFAEDGKQECFSPVDADVWSYGASMYYFVGRVHPFNVKAHDENIDGETRNVIASCTALTDSAKYWLFGLMRSDTRLRTKFEDIPNHNWYQGIPDAPSDTSLGANA